MSSQRGPLYYGHQYLDHEDLEAVLAVLRSDRLTQGPVVEEFEASLRDYLGVGHAVSCINGTMALHLAALGLGIGADDVVLVPAITFLATANCARYVGAEPYFVDVEDDTVTIDPGEVERQIERLRTAGRRVRAIVGVDLAGHPCDWPALGQIAERHDLALIGDSCHALGGVSRDGSKVASGAHAHVSTLSFHPVKHITTGEGGALVTNDSAIAKRAERLRNHGTTRDPEALGTSDGPWVYDMVELGFNYRLSDLQAALGVSQLRKLPWFLERRRSLAALYDQLFSGADLVRCPTPKPGTRHAYHLYVVRIDFSRAAVSKRELFRLCAERDLHLQVHYRPLPENSYYRAIAQAQGSYARLPVAYRYYAEAVSLPLHPGLSEDDVTWVAETILELVEGRKVSLAGAGRPVTETLRP